MVSDKAKAYLKERYGDRYFGWDIEDHHLDEFFDENDNISYAELNRKCTDLENLIKEIEEKVKEMQRIVDDARKTGNPQR